MLSRSLIRFKPLLGILFTILFWLAVLPLCAGKEFTFRVDKFLVRNLMIEKGKVRASDTAEYFLTNLDHPMNSGEQKKYMEGELHQYYHNRQEGWIHRWKARGENQKWSTAQDTGIPQLTTLRRKLDPLLGRFPEQFINILYSPDINTLRIRFHPQENKNEAFYRQMMSLLNSQL